VGDLWGAVGWVGRTLPQYPLGWSDLFWAAGLVGVVVGAGRVAKHIQRSEKRDQERAEQESRRG
jgi:hypothetical protein